MKKLVLLGFALTIISLSSYAQFNVNINIGPQPAYVPVRYVTSSHYYAPARPVYVSNRYVKVMPRRNHYRPQRTYYKSRPVVYREVHYKQHKGKKQHYYNGKGKKHRR
ncbi:MAG: hypothetical protein EOO92_13855 [Pedobacter sp.]|nr:MAG: hypothetical protein EOO92_13855 [Pedobacter sp.]